MLNNIYGKVEDGHEIMISFHSTYQEDKETASAYLNRLFLILVQAADKKALQVSELPLCG
jgi:hypothetical protein